MGMQYEILRRDNSDRFIDSERPADVPEAGVNAPKVYGNGKIRYKAGDYVKSQEEKLHQPRKWIVNNSSNKNLITQGSAVKIRFPNGNEEIYIIVNPNDANSDLNQISKESPLGSALIGKKFGDTIKFSAPAGTVECEILKIWDCYIQNSSENNKKLNSAPKTNNQRRKHYK